MLLRCCLIHISIIMPRHLLYLLYVVRCAIWYCLYNLKNVKNTHGGVLILVKLKLVKCKLTLLHGCFSRFLKCTNGTKWYQIAQCTTYLCPCLGLGRFMSYLCDLLFIFSLIFSVINHITSLKQTHFVHFVECLLFFLADSLDEESE